MSFSLAEAIVERHDCINQAILEGNVEALRQYAELYAKEGEDEAAEYVLNLAKRAKLDEWALDEKRDNELTI